MPSVYLTLSKESQPRISVCLDKHKLWTIPSANMTFTTLQNYIYKYGGWQAWNTNIWSCACCLIDFVIVG